VYSKQIIEGAGEFLLGHLHLNFGVSVPIEKDLGVLFNEDLSPHLTEAVGALLLCGKYSQCSTFCGIKEKQEVCVPK
jgi:hypothetical protein